MDRARFRIPSPPIELDRAPDLLFHQRFTHSPGREHARKTSHEKKSTARWSKSPSRHLFLL
jgi:hypothetical protein